MLTNEGLDSGQGPLPLYRGGAVEQIMADLKEQILQGRLVRGAKLPNERALAEQYRVSGPTIREAMRGLAAVNLVRIRQGSGTYVTAAADVMFDATASTLVELENVGLLDILDLLETLYVKAAILACRHAADEELARLETSLDFVERASSAEFATCLTAFLGGLADASHNPLLATFCKFLNNLLLELAPEQSGGALVLSDVAEKLRLDRRNLVKALKARDAEQSSLMAASYHVHTRSLVADLLTKDRNGGHESIRRASRRLRQSVGG
jgi:DNA-binding FadR family transcriptional regulator